MIEIKGLSKRETEIIAWLEFYEKYFFTIQDIRHFFKNQGQRYNTIKNLVKKKRVIKINREKYYLVPMKAKSGAWAENSYIIADEIFNGEHYFIGSWAAANYWQLTEQIPMRFDIWTTRRQGKCTILTSRFVFHRTTKRNIERKSTEEKIKGHTFRIMKRREAAAWLKLHQ